MKHQNNIMKKTVLLLLVPLSLLSQTPSALLKQYMTGQNKYFQFNGNILVAEKGTSIYQQALGYADYNTKRMLNDSSVFELASLSKQFTAMGIMILKEKKQLNYDDNVKKFLPDFPYGNITIRQLLTHTSGLPAYEDQFEKHWDHSKIAHNKDIVDMLKQLQDTLFFEPGTKWKYSNTGYAILALIIDQVSEMDYNEFMSKYIFKPLGMDRTFIYNTRRTTGKMPSNYALGYVYSDSLKRYILPDSLKAYNYVYYLDGIVGDGCVNSTIGDLLKWDKALYTNKLVSQQRLDEMFSPLVQTSPADTTSFYGFGEFIQPHSEKGKVISHTGSWPGYRTLMVRRPDIAETIIILSNNESSIPFFRAAVESILNGESLIMPYEHKEIKIDPALLDDYVGKYSAGLTLEFIKKDGKLYRHRNGTADIELKPESTTKFFYADGTDRQIEFEKDNNGKVIRVWFMNMGQKGEMKKQ
jgi:CubicO group peptidase (beta-lactamase class C family)